jgi:hypothetical protein
VTDRTQLEKDRTEVYGDPYESHMAIGLAWEGILRNRFQSEFTRFKPGELFPPEIVALMMSSFKNVRAARPHFNKDSYDDAHIYLDFSERFRCP